MGIGVGQTSTQVLSLSYHQWSLRQDPWFSEPHLCQQNEDSMAEGCSEPSWRLPWPASLAARCGHGSNLWPMRCKWQLLCGISGKVSSQSKLELEKISFAFLFFLTVRDVDIKTGATAAILGHEVILKMEFWTKKDRRSLRFWWSRSYY